MTYQLKDYLYSINQSKRNILDGDSISEKSYQPFIVNRCLSSFTDTILYSNEMNKNPHLPKRMQYDFFINSVKPRKRFSPWIKKDSIDFLDVVKLIRSSKIKTNITTDVIVGFPGETEEYFMETLDLLKELKISYLHVFTYSERNNTLASTMDSQVPKETRTKRSMILRSLSDKKRRIFYQSQIGLDKTVLYETENKKGYIYGYTENYLRVRTPWDPKLANKLIPIRINEIDKDGYFRVEERIQEACLTV